MHVINARNVNDAFASGLRLLLNGGDVEESRNGSVLVFPRPVTTVYYIPTERVLFSPLRDANPFFHLMEALWMLAGRNDLAFLTQFAKNMASFSDDGLTIRGAYGYRWRQYFSYDQIEWAIGELRSNPTSRRVVISMWDPGDERSLLQGCGDELTGDPRAIAMGTKDAPCNTHIYFRTVNGKLDMTVCNRSNDVVWGAYGANAVHMSILHEYVATAIGMPVGIYRQVSNNFHLYTSIIPMKRIQDYIDDAVSFHLYGRVALRLQPLMSIPRDAWDMDLMRFMTCDPLNPPTFVDPFFSTVALPMYQSWIVRKKFKTEKCEGHTAMDLAQSIASDDWRMAASSWIERRDYK